MARVIHSVLLLHSFPSLFNSAFSAYVLNGFWRGSQIAFHWPAPADNVTDQRLVNWHIPCLLTVSAYHKNYREEFSSTSGSSLQMLSKLPFTISHVARDGSQSTFFFFFNFYFVLGYNQLTMLWEFQLNTEGTHSAIHINVSSLPQTLLPSRLLHNIEQSSMCYTTGPCWLSILNTVAALFVLKRSAWALWSVTNLVLLFYPDCPWCQDGVMCYRWPRLSLDLYAKKDPLSYSLDRTERTNLTTKWG